MSNAPSGPAARPPHFHRRRRVLVSVGVVLLLGGGWLTYRWQQRGPEEASLSDTVERYRDSSSSSGDGGPQRPAPGVYAYQGEGRERLSFLSTGQPQGPVIPATVRLDGDRCWTQTFEYNSFHSQTWRWCLDGPDVVETGGRTTQAFDFGAFAMTERSTSTCDPPVDAIRAGAGAGDSWIKRCTSESSTTESGNAAAGTVTYVGREVLRIAGVAQPTLHYHMRVTFSGDQRGEDTLDFWFDPDRHLVVKGVRSLRVTSPAPPPLNEVTYREQGEWTLSSLEPQR